MKHSRSRPASAVNRRCSAPHNAVRHLDEFGRHFFESIHADSTLVVLWRNSPLRGAKSGGSAFCTAERCREISQGYACFTRTPGSGERLKPAPSEGCEESSHAFSVRHWVNAFTRGCAPLNPWLIFCHPFGVSFETETS